MVLGGFLPTAKAKNEFTDPDPNSDLVIQFEKMTVALDMSRNCMKLDPGLIEELNINSAQNSDLK